MKEKLKVFFLGFFSDNVAKKAEKGGLLLMFINFILALTVLFVATFTIETAAFYPRYASAENLKQTVDNLFRPSDRENAVTLYLSSDGYVLAKRGDGEYQSAVIVDTFLSEEDRLTYSAGGFNVVVDTREAGLYDDFIAYCQSDDGLKISYEEYLDLTELAKKSFTFKIEYTPNEVDLSNEKTAERKTYLSEHAQTELDALDEKLSSGELDEIGYNGQVWALYVKTYYPDLKEYETITGVPLLRNYYYHNYTLNGETDYLFVFNDSVIGSFTEKNGKVEEFYGFYQNFSVGEITDGESFIKTAYSASIKLNEYVAFMRMMRFLPIYMVMPIVVALIAYLIIKIGARERAGRFLPCLKVVATFIFWSSLISAAVTYILSFFVERSLIFMLLSSLFFVVMMVRGIIWMIGEITRLNSAKTISEPNEQENKNT